MIGSGRSTGHHATLLTPVVSGRKYLPLNPVAGTIDHVQMSLFCCPLPLLLFVCSNANHGCTHIYARLACSFSSEHV